MLLCSVLFSILNFMNTKTIYALNRAGSEGDYMGPFFETEEAAKKSVEEKKAASNWPLDIWFSKETLILENEENLLRHLK